MIDMLLQYGLFLAKALTVVVAVGMIVMLVIGLSRKTRHGDTLEVKKLNDKYEAMAEVLNREVLTKPELKKYLKELKAAAKAEKKGHSGGAHRNRVFVLNFRGDIKATGVASLREEITAMLTMASGNDEVVVRLENAGGLVHEHGLAASQLLRIKQGNVPLTVAVDKVAASGGYMMACVADRIVAAPFAVVGSVGVLAQVPNFHRLLEKHGVQFELVKAGELKRTLTMFGENTEQDRQIFQEQLEDTHELFKTFVAEQRPSLDMQVIGTGEHWYGRRAIELNLVDELTTSDDYLLAKSENNDLYELTYSTHKTLGERVAGVIEVAVDRFVLGWWGRTRESRLPQ